MATSSEFVHDTARCPQCPWSCAPTGNTVRELARVLVLFEDHLVLEHDWRHALAGEHAQRWAAGVLGGDTRP